jgi:C4-dicarboxylate-specific signal transduction histidine kinase
MATCPEVVTVEDDLREVAFLGKITAAFTHEMKNVLAIIKESAGLMEDLLSLSQNATFPHRERFGRALGTIEAQAKRGIELSSRLNRFAHSPDAAVATIDLNEILEQIIFLSGRFARLKGVTLSLDPHAHALPLITSPVVLQMVIFCCLECCWEVLGTGGNIALSAGQKGQEVVIGFVCRSGGDSEEDLAERVAATKGRLVLNGMMKSLKCRIECGASRYGFDLILPAAG